MGNGAAFTNEAFDLVFKNFDKVGSGRVDKDEMAIFMG